MNKKHSLFLVFFSAFIFTGCSVMGNSNVEIAPYSVLEKDNNLELRHYDQLILVSTPMNEGMDGQNEPFSKLFRYISGNNDEVQKIPMTAPVFMDQENQKTETMSFVLPKSYNMNDAPRPQDPTVELEELKDYTVASIIFSGFLNQDNINKHKRILEQWIEEKGYTRTGPVKAAGYNPPFTIPALRRNEVLIPVKKP